MTRTTTRARPRRRITTNLFGRPWTCYRGAPAGSPHRPGRRRGRGAPRSGRRAVARARSKPGAPAWPPANTSPGGPSTATSPWRITMIRSKWRAANSMSWVIATTVRPPAAIASTIAPIRAMPATVLAGRGLVEDEDGRVDREDAGERDELAPRQVEVVRVGRPGVGEPGRGDRASIEPPGVGRTRSRGSAGRTTTSRSTLRSNSWSSGFWNTKPTDRRQAVDRFDRRCPRPPTRTRPAVRPQQAVEMLRERRLARPVLADDRDRLARLDPEVDAAERLRRRPGSGGRRRRPRSASGGRPRTAASREAPCVVGGRRRVGPRAGPAARASCDAPLVERLARRSSPAASASATSVGGCESQRREDRAVPSARPARRAPPRSPALEDDDPVRRRPARPGRAPRRASSRPSRADLARGGRRDCIRPQPGRAEPSARRGRGRGCPSPRCWRSRPAAARPPDSANGSRSARWAMPSRSRTTSSIRWSISARGTPRFSSPNASSSRTRELRGGQLVRRRREDDADPPSRSAARRLDRVDAVDPQRPVDRGSDDARDEPRDGQREGRLAGTRPPGDAERSPGRRERSTP